MDKIKPNSISCLTELVTKILVIDVVTIWVKTETYINRKRNRNLHPREWDSSRVGIAPGIYGFAILVVIRTGS